MGRYKIKNGRLPMRDIKRIIQLYYHSQLSVREISGALRIPCSTVGDYLQRFKDSGLALADLQEKDAEVLYEQLFGPPPLKAKKASKPLPNFAQIHQELKRKHVTRLLLWEEYRQCRFYFIN